MINNKKSIMKVFIFVLVIGVLLLTFMFRLIFVKEIGDEYLVGTLTAAGIAVLNQTNNPESISTILQLRSDYDDISQLPYDTIFLVFWLLSITFTFLMAYKARKLSNFSFYGLLFFGSFILLIFVGFVEQFTGWFLNNFYNPLFSDINLNTPIMDWYFNNLPLISFLWAIICLGINRIEIKAAEIKGRPQE